MAFCEQEETTNLSRLHMEGLGASRLHMEAPQPALTPEKSGRRSPSDNSSRQVQ
jgi:hypothetical protein